jgi:glycosyltransferase involved in cell wall biosynthesis
MKLFLAPVQFELGNGIGQVLQAQHRYLPEFGIELVENPNEADLRAAHIWSPLLNNEILHNHGCHWNGDEPGHPEWEGEINQVIMETAKSAWAITVPSEWCSLPFKRDMRLSPTVIGHGLNLEEWQPLPVAERQNFILWNKNRVDRACDPQAAVELARRGLPVVSTFGNPNEMLVTGPVPHAEMKEYLRRAGVYLSTSKETFGIGILEALACGVPVLGYATGGILDLVQHKVNGYLVEPGDLGGLEAGYKWLMENRESLQGAILASVANKDWRSIIGRYARLYEEVLERKQRPRKVSVVITNYNYGEFVGGAIESALGQSRSPEIIVVDDGSTDESDNILQSYSKEGSIRLITQSNSGVAAARNTGINAATGEYVVCLDADDWLEPASIETLFTAMEADRALGIAYTGLQMHFENGESSVSGWPPKFDFNAMAKPGIPPPNHIPCAAMFRRDMWERAGGYRQEYAPGEDVEFWLRGLSVGFNAKKVTDEPLFNYRLHGGSASRTKEYKDITADKPWVKDRNLMPMAAPTKRANLVRSYSEPLVSVIIPVGPGHAKHLNKALDSLVAQTFKGWEVIVIDDSNPQWVGDGLNVSSYPFVFRASTIGNEGAGAARNIGIEKAKAPLLFFLDADDYLVPTALEEMVRAYTKSKKTYVFSDWYAANPGKELEHMNCPDYHQETVREKIQHAVSVLVETEAVRKVGGFDESLVTYEDWDFFLKLAAKGYCGVRVPKPLLVYRTGTGTRRLKAQQPGSTVYQTITDRWKGVKFMPCCGQSAKIERVAVDMLAFPVQSSDVPDGKIRLRYVGSAQGGVTYLGKYQVAALPQQDTADVNPEDVSKLLQLGVFQEV